MRRTCSQLGARAGYTALAVGALGLLVASCGGASDAAAGQPLPTRASPLKTPSGSGAVNGFLHSPGGPFIYDAGGRVVFLHGVDAVYKRPPYELYPAPGKRWNFDARDASLLARLGFNVVRLGMTWKGLEPGTAPANDPAICARGAPGDPGQFNQRVLDAYLARLARTVAILGRYHIYTLLDMHQDVYNEAFDGEGAPNWAVCTNGIKIGEPPGRWSANYATRAAGTAYGHFWRNDVVGDLQGEYDRVWAAVAAYFRTNPWVVGYDPFNEPFSRSLVTSGDEQFDAQLECFYTGTAHVGRPAHGGPSFSCPSQDPAAGVIPQILAADPSHLVFYEPDIFGRRGAPNFVGPMDFPNLVFNVHIYCSYRSGKTGNPTNLSACAAQEAASLARRAEDRLDLSTPEQPGGPAWFVSEYGATSSVSLLESITAAQWRHLVGSAYWSWRYYGDPTGSAAEALVGPGGTLRSTARVLAATYPEAVAGRPTSVVFDPASGAFSLRYRPTAQVRGPTVIFVPVRIHYPDGYCARVLGGRVTSAPGAGLLLVTNANGARSVNVAVSAGHCR